MKGFLEMNKEKIFEHLKNHYNELKKHFSENQILGVFLYGSQNYGTDTETSDVDTRAIYVPSLYEVLFEKPVSKEIILENGEHCDVKDIREYVKALKKQNITYVETLFTDYFILNPDYKDIWDDTLYKFREEISYYNYPGTISAMTHTCLNYIKGKNNCSGKVLSNVKRILYFLENYIQEKDYKDCLYIKDESFRNELTLLKKESNIEVENDLESYFNNFLSIAKENLNRFKPVSSPVNYVLESFVMASFKRREALISF
jgi:predicted nucleotidyltransferase